MLSSKQIQIVAYLVSGAYSRALLVAGLHLPNSTLKALTILPIVIVGLFAVFDGYLWRIWPIRSVITNRPRLRGTWTGNLISYRINDKGIETCLPPIPIIVVVHQTYSVVSVTLMTAESQSRSIVATIHTDSHRRFTLYYHYINVPELPRRKVSQIHFGGTALHVSQLDPTHVRGEYWTDQDSKGTLELTLKSKSIVGSFEDVQTAPSIEEPVDSNGRI